MKVVGFDFGTTNSLISLVRGRRVVSFLDEEERPIPSVVCYEGGGKILGREAKGPPNNRFPFCHMGSMV